MIDFMVMEAVALKVQKEDEKARENAKKKQWQQERDHLKNM